MERLDKLIGNRTQYSRANVRTLCKQGRVEVNDVVVRDSSTKISDGSVVKIDGDILEVPPDFVKFHKPDGVISTMSDNWDREDFGDLLPEGWQGHLHPVGRLDADTTGLIIFSSDGKITQKLLHPRHSIEREYLAVVENPVDKKALTKMLAEGVETAEGVVEANLVEVSGQNLRLTVTEGKHRMVRRVLNNAGHPVVSLHRTRYGKIQLKDLPVGEFQEITGAELEWLKSF